MYAMYAATLTNCYLHGGLHIVAFMLLACHVSNLGHAAAQHAAKMAYSTLMSSDWMYTYGWLVVTASQEMLEVYAALVVASDFAGNVIAHVMRTSEQLPDVIMVSTLQIQIYASNMSVLHICVL